jgi:hypothetical protein
VLEVQAGYGADGQVEAWSHADLAQGVAEGGGRALGEAAGGGRRLQARLVDHVEQRDRALGALPDLEEDLLDLGRTLLLLGLLARSRVTRTDLGEAALFDEQVLHQVALRLRELDGDDGGHEVFS